MKNLRTFLNVFGMILKYSAVLLAVVKGLEVMNEELNKIVLPEEKKDANNDNQ